MTAVDNIPANDRSMETFYGVLKAKNMDALWRMQAANPPGSRTGPLYPPCLWSGAELRELMTWATELVQPGPDAERRVISLQGPGHGTLTAAVQMVLPGEVAPSHRHTPAAIRFILEGRGAATIVNGEPCVMTPGDLVLTPAWSWHGHINEADGPMMWMDGLDAPLVNALGAGFRFEEYPEGGIQPSSKAQGDSYKRYGAAHLRPLWGRESQNVSPLMVYPWAQTEEALQNLAKIDASPFDDVAMEYTNPVTGGHVMPTIACCIQLLRPGIRTQAHRHTASGFYHVFRGRGRSILDGVSYEWTAGDYLRLPPQVWHEHENASATEDAILFSISDAPVSEALNLYFEEAYANGGHQTIRSSNS
jgi:gentisate 1,2-dioxygenase